MYIAILGRQPNIGIAELERVFGHQKVTPVSEEAVVVASQNFDINRLGGIPKAGKIIDTLSDYNWQHISQFITRHYTQKWSSIDNKITLGISVYGSNISSYEIQKIGLNLKKKLKAANVSLRLIPNQTTTLSSATSHHNKLGLSPNKVEVLIIQTSDRKTIIAESIGAQNISAYAARDQKRPKRDAFVGMLPPKLAQIMLNIAVGNDTPDTALTVLDPFCGTGVVLQEAILSGFSVYGTDLSEKMVSYSKENLAWLLKKYDHRRPDIRLETGDATKYKWKRPINVVVCEAYLGQPFSAPPSPAKLQDVRNNCDHIISTFLNNISSQIESGTRICIALPAWRDKFGNFTHLPLLNNLKKLGFDRYRFDHTTTKDILYYRTDQIVARELILIAKI